MNKKLFPIFFITGSAFLCASLARTYLMSQMDLLSSVGFWVGVLVVLSSLFFIRMSFIKFFDSQKLLKTGLSSLIIFILFLFVVSINYLAVKTNIRLDFTRTKQHTLSQTTKQILKNLKQDVKITAFHVGIAPQYLEDMFRAYKQLSPQHITTEIIDPLVQIGYAAKFGNVISGDEKVVFVQAGREKKEVDFRETPLTEEQLTNAIVKAAREKRTLYVLSGHNEIRLDNTEADGASKLKTMLENMNCDIHDLILAKNNSVPNDCDVLIVLGPKNPLPQKEEEIIQSYLAKGGKALFFIQSAPIVAKENPEAEKDKLKNPSLNGILNHWGLKIGNDVVVDLENYAGNDVGCPVTKSYPPHKQIVSNLDYTLYIRPRSITFLSDHAKTIRYAPLVRTASQRSSWAQPTTSLRVKFDETEDIAGPISIAAVVWEPKDEKKKSDTKIIVFADAEFITNNFINQYSNADIVLNSVSWLSELENVISIDSKKAQIERLNLSNKQTRLIVIILIFMPVIVALCGCLTWWRQQNISSN